MNRGPLIIAILLLLLPVLYAASYLALVDPGESWSVWRGGHKYVFCYRYFGPWDGIGEPPPGACIAPTIFWPLEQIDRKVRPGAWGSPYDPTDYQNVSVGS